MINEENSHSLDMTGATAGLLAIVCYFGAAVLPLPQTIGNLMGFAFGPLIIVSYIGINSFLGKTSDGVLLRISYIFGVIYGAIVASLIFIQVANNIWHSEAMAAASSLAEKENLALVHRAVNRVQAALDVTFDVFVTVSVILLGFVLLKNSVAAKVIGVLGILVASLLLFLNLYTFPTAPAEAGLFDAGPFLGLWYLVFFIWMLAAAFGGSRTEDLEPGLHEGS